MAGFLTARGHAVTLLIGEQATHCGERQARRVETFTTSDDLRERLRKLSGEAADAVFHAAAVSDFRFGKVWRRAANGALGEVQSGKLPTGAGTLLAELVPTAKIIAELRGWFPRARLAGWKYEVEGGRAAAVALGEAQMAECRTDACVVNGRAYGAGFGLVTGPGKCLHLPDAEVLYGALEGLVRIQNGAGGGG